MTDERRPREYVVCRPEEMAAWLDPCFEDAWARHLGPASVLLARRLARVPAGDPLAFEALARSIGLGPAKTWAAIGRLATWQLLELSFESHCSRALLSLSASYPQPPSNSSRAEASS